MVDATLAAPPLDHTARRRARPAALSNANANACAGAVAAAPNKPKAKTVASRYLTPASTERSRPPQHIAVATSDAAASCGSATTTTRTLAVAFQSPAYSLETSRAWSASPTAAPASHPHVVLQWRKRRSQARRSRKAKGSVDAKQWESKACKDVRKDRGKVETKAPFGCP